MTVFTCLMAIAAAAVSVALLLAQGWTLASALMLAPLAGSLAAAAAVASVMALARPGTGPGTDR